MYPCSGKKPARIIQTNRRADVVTTETFVLYKFSSLSIMYQSKIFCVHFKFIYISLNRPNYIHVHVSPCQLLHRRTPFTDMEYGFVFVFANCFLNVHIQLRLRLFT